MLIVKIIRDLSPPATKVVSATRLSFEEEGDNVVLLLNLQGSIRVSCIRDIVRYGNNAYGERKRERRRHECDTGGNYRCSS